MKFGARYEILRALTRGEVETFAVRERATGEKALAHIFECPEPPLDQPTVQWVVASFLQLAPETPGTVIDVGRYDVVSFAYIVTRWPADEAVDNWVREYHNQIGVRPTGDAPDSASSQPAGKQQAAAPDLPPAPPAALDDALAAGSESQVTSRAPGEFTRQFFGGMAFPGERVSGKEALDAEQRGGLESQTIVPDKDRSGTDISESIGRPASPLVTEAAEKPSPSQGGFTQQFFREINPPPDRTSEPSAGSSAFPGAVEAEPARQPDALTSPWDKPPIPSSTALDLNNQPLAPDSPSDQFTKLFAQDLGSAMSPPVQDEVPSQEQPRPASGEFTKLFRVPPAMEETKSSTNDGFASESRSSTGEFARMFGPYVPNPLNDVGSLTGNERGVMPAQGSSTGILNGSNTSDRRSAEDSYTPGRATPAGNVDEGSATEVFGERRGHPEYSDRTFSHEPLTDPAHSSQDPLPDSRQFNADDSGGATVLFRPQAEVAAESAPGLPTGPSEYTMFMNREALSASLSGSADASSSSGGSKAGGAAAAAAAVASPFVTPPAVPTYQVPSPQVPAYPAAPAIPGVASPAMPAVAPPAVAAPSVSAPAGQPSAGPKSYWPLIIILNVLFILAVLLILYFALRH